MRSSPPKPLGGTFLNLAPVTMHGDVERLALYACVDVNYVQVITSLGFD